MQPFSEILKLARQYGFVLKRSKRHAVFVHEASGRIVSTSLSPSDNYAVANAEKDFARTANDWTARSDPH